MTTTVTYQKKPPAPRFNQLKEGDLFNQHSWTHLYVKIAEVKNEAGRRFNAVQIATGGLDFVFPDSLVKVYDATICCSERENDNE